MQDHDTAATNGTTPSVRPPGPNDGPLFISVWEQLHADSAVA